MRPPAGDSHHDVHFGQAELREADLEGIETEARREREGGERRARGDQHLGGVEHEARGERPASRAERRLSRGEPQTIRVGGRRQWHRSGGGKLGELAERFGVESYRGGNGVVIERNPMIVANDARALSSGGANRVITNDSSITADKLI